jgi:hypothetical protein
MVLINTTSRRQCFATLTKRCAAIWMLSRLVGGDPFPHHFRRCARVSATPIRWSAAISGRRHRREDLRLGALDHAMGHRCIKESCMGSGQMSHAWPTDLDYADQMKHGNLWSSVLGTHQREDVRPGALDQAMGYRGIRESWLGSGQLSHADQQIWICCLHYVLKHYIYWHFMF